LQVPYAEGV